MSAMTEEQAREKWCPQVRHAIMAENQLGGVIAVGSANAGRAKLASLCIASGCMMWRKLTVMIDRATNEPAIPGVAAQGDLEERYSNSGYCGLAGKPQ